MAAKTRKKKPGTIFEGIRKPVAPPSQKIGEARPEEKIHPTGRKAKYKKRDDRIDKNEDF